MHAPAIALTIAGSDCSSGAGIQADLKTFQYFRVHGLTAVTCVVSETANIVRAVHPVPIEVVIDQISLLLDSFPVAAVKTGMLYSAPLVTAVAEILSRHSNLPLVVDPVMVASTGAPLLEKQAVDAYVERLFPLARVITPNLPEAEVLLGESIQDETALEAAALRLAARYGTSVLLKGGHLDTSVCLDVLAEGGNLLRFSAKRIPLASSHGTGCTFSAAITAGLAKGESLQKAVGLAKEFLGNSLLHSYEFSSRDGEIVRALNQGSTLPKNEA
jgi:hydroxymethylpyrimidine/phosphomethylpyrimidine kinase